MVALFHDAFFSEIGAATLETLERVGHEVVWRPGVRSLSVLPLAKAASPNLLTEGKYP